MSFFQATFLAIIQGLTEFLPISSSGHLVLLQKIFRVSTPPVLFDILLHLGTLLAVVIFFRKVLCSLIKDWKKNLTMWKLLIIGTFPVAIFGYWINKLIEEIFNSLKFVGFMWLIMGAMLLRTKKLKQQGQKNKLVNIKNVDALVIGIFQAFALFPGISRSGSTIIGGLTRQLSEENAFNFSFLLAIPAILGATVLKLKDGTGGGIGPATTIVCLTIAGIAGYFSLRFLQKVLQSNKFYLFGWYCLGLGVIGLLVSSRI